MLKGSYIYKIIICELINAQQMKRKYENFSILVPTIISKVAI